MLTHHEQGFQLFTRRNILLLFGTICLVTGIRLQRPMMLMVAAMCYAVAGLAFWQAFRLLRSVKVKREHQSRAFQDTTLPVQLRIECKAGPEQELVLVEDLFPPSLTFRIRRLLLTPLRPGTMAEIGYTGACEHRRGLYTLGPVRMQAQDPLGLFDRKLLIDHFTNLVIYPQAVDLNVIDLLGEGTLPHVGLDTTPRTGFSEEFIGIRSYRTGDAFNTIHWRGTARHGRLMVKEFQEEMTTLVSFFLDLGRLGLVGVGDQTSVEYSIKCCASLVKRVVERGHRIQFFGVGQDLEHISPGSGVKHLQAVLDRLALVKPEGKSVFTAVVGDLVQELPRGSTAVLLMGATTVRLEQIEPVLLRLIDRLILPIVVLIDDRAFIKIFREQEETHSKALPLEEVARRLMLLGADVRIIRKDKSMRQALLQGLEREYAG